MIKILMLVGAHNDNLIFETNSECEGTFEDIYLTNHFVKYFRNISLLTGLSLKEWKNHLRSFDIVFCIDSIITPKTLNWICKHKGNSRMILYFRNKFSEKRWNIDWLKRLPIEIWSYNLHDCEKYGFQYNCEVANRKLYYGYDTSKREYSLSFVGANKGRDVLVKDIYNRIKNTHLPRPFIYMVGAPDEEWNNCKDNKYFPHAEYLNVSSKSIAILDLVSEENYGLTVRAVEAMFLKKKLITNYEDIKRYDFYDRNNIFILGIDNLDDLEEFLQSPYKEIPEEIINSYSTNDWIKRFLTHEHS